MGQNFQSLRISSQAPIWGSADFGPWTPDLISLSSGSFEALGVIPAQGDYIPFPSIVVQSGLTISEECRGAIMVANRLGDLLLFAATKAHIYCRVSGSFVSLWNGGPLDDNYYHWRFIEYGDYLVAIHPYSDSLAAALAPLNNFEGLGTGDNPAPRASCGARVGDFLVLGNLTVDYDDGNSYQPQRVRWSPFNNPDGDWNTDPNTQADFQDMPSEGGSVMGIVGREYGTIFQERLISRMRYVGLPNVFEFETLEEVRGALCTGGIVNVGAQAFFIAEDGFFLWNGVNSVPIGNSKVNAYFRKRLNYEFKDEIVGALDDSNSCVWWAFPSITGDERDEIIIYSYLDGRWSHVYQVTEYIFSSYEIPSDESLPFRATKHLISGFFYSGGSNHRYVTFTGTPVEAILETTETAAPDSQRIFVNKVRPIIDNASNNITATMLLRDQFIGGSDQLIGPVSQEVDGTIPVEADARYLRARLTIPAGLTWTHAKGIEVSRSTAGEV